MFDDDKIYEMIRKSIRGIYSSPQDRSSVVILTKLVTDWEDGGSSGNELQSQKIFEELQTLNSYLDNRGHTAQADEIFRLILSVFPEKYFPSLPWLRESQDIDYRLLEDSIFVARSKSYPDFALESLRLFEEQFRMVDQKLMMFALEVENGQYRESGAGAAGELFRRYADLVEKLALTPLRDLPWSMMNQMAMKLNNNLSKFYAAYLVVKANRVIKNSRPSQGLQDLINRNEVFFLRNFYWKCIDDDQANRNYSALVQDIDKLLPLSNYGDERSTLLIMRNQALKKINQIPRNFMTYVFFALITVSIVVVVMHEPPARTSLSLDRSREELIAAARRANEAAREESAVYESSKDDLDRALEVSSNTGLRERKPPLRPHNRKLDLFEIRHAVFQKIRLDYLRDQKLSVDEQIKLEGLTRDYVLRCEFYEYDSSDREKVHWDAKIHMPNLVKDAQEIQEKWRKASAPIDVKKLVSEQLLNLNNPEHLRILLERLKNLDYYREKELSGTWSEPEKRALLDFKVTNMGVVDSNWDMKTQKALFNFKH